MTDKLETYALTHPETTVQLTETTVQPIQPDEWARLDPNGKLIYLDLDKAGNSTLALLAIGVWNAAIEDAAKAADSVLESGGKTLGDVIRRMKK